MFRKTLALLATLVGLLAGLPMVYAQTAPGLDLERIQRATVFIMQTQNIGGRPVITCLGSGTIVNRTGLIATNAHFTAPNADCPGDNLVIALNTRPGETPIPTYYAEIAEADIGLDLALLRITQEMSGRVIEPDSLSLPFVALGDSSQVNLDDTIIVMGYPDVDSSPVTSYRGTIRGYIAEPSGGERSWIKTDATIPGTMTGGGVYNQDGQLIGIPTTVPVTPLSDETNCLPLEDTNNDGQINSSDRCVPIGGFINALRPVNFIRPLLRSASLGISVEKLTGSNIQFAPTDEPSISNVIISSSVNEGMPASVVGRLPTGATSLYLFFDYANMTPETIYELRITVDNLPNTLFNLPPVRWSGGTNGMWYIGSSGQVWPDGIYEFTLFIDGLASASASIVVGGPPPDDQPLFRNISFGIEAGDNLFGIGGVLPSGSIANARFVHRNVPDGTEWTRVWYYNGSEIPGSREIEPWANDGRDWKVIRIESGSGEVLPPGRYRLDLYIENRLSARSEFIIAGASEGALPRPFTNPRFTAAPTPQEAAAAPALNSFSSNVPEVYALFDWERVSPGTLWRLRLIVDDSVFYDQLVPWGGMENGENYLVRLAGDTTLPDGNYRMEILLNNARLVEIEMNVGIGQLPLDQFSTTSGVQLNGRIIDAETGDGIPGVSFMLISEDFSVITFTWRRDQIYAMATTDRDGYFQLDRLLEFGALYSVMIRANGYLPLAADAVSVTEESENPLFIQIPLLRD